MYSKTIGILGGMGPKATAHFYSLLLQEVGEVEHEAEYPKVLISSNPQMPSRTRAILHGEESPLPAILEEADKLLNAGAHFIVMPCNSAHYFIKSLPNTDNFLSIVDVTLDYCREIDAKRPVLLSGHVPRATKLYGDEVLYLTDGQQALLDEIIYKAKHSQIKVATTMFASFRRAACGHWKTPTLIMRCTELSLLADHDERNIDTSLLLAKAALRKAM